ncbi:Uncharacterised protein [Shewanella baltica]|nr:Uncharacterised protein [Shewanella baltica]
MALMKTDLNKKIQQLYDMTFSDDESDEFP